MVFTQLYIDWCFHVLQAVRRLVLMSTGYYANSHHDWRRVVCTIVCTIEATTVGTSMNRLQKNCFLWSEHFFSIWFTKINTIIRFFNMSMLFCKYYLYHFIFGGSKRSSQLSSVVTELCQVFLNTFVLDQWFFPFAVLVGWNGWIQNCTCGPQYDTYPFWKE